ncbi:hypothetical protein [Sphaerisporangium fuscum]|uniref:hypothetical protein n=1 Tax=Sphaerisporangium fuscum TaxID=2835868 RepID=UPI001BDCE050|nr:hypothetical protein [Sphaerisporangium fuscum]
MLPKDTVEYRLPALIVRVRSAHSQLFDYLDSFHDRVTREGDGAEHMTVSLNVELGTAAATVEGAVVCDAGIDPPEFTFQEARHRIRELWQDHLTATRTAFNLHAAAVDDGETVTVFVGERYRGKTTLLLDNLAMLPCDHLTNDNLVVYESDEGPQLTSVATYLKVRTAPAIRFATMLASRAAASRHGTAMWRRYLRDPSAFPFHTEAMLPPAGFGRWCQPIVPLADRRLVLVQPEFTQGLPSVSCVHDKSSLVGENLKWLAEPSGGGRDLITAFAARAEVVRLRHKGSIAPLLLDQVTT